MSGPGLADDTEADAIPIVRDADHAEAKNDQLQRHEHGVGVAERAFLVHGTPRSLILEQVTNKSPYKYSKKMAFCQGKSVISCFILA